MADRYFANEMPPFIPENQTKEAGLQRETPKNSLTTLLHLPYSSLSQTLKTSALHLKDTIVKETWGSSGRRLKDYTLYTGALGTAFLLFKAYQVMRNEADLKLCSDIIKACDTAASDSGRVTFICGQAGVCALGAVVAKHSGREDLIKHYLTRFKEIQLPRDLPNELLYGRAGFLWACSFLNKHLGKGTISTARMRAVVNDVITSGRRLGKNGKCSLMYEWHGKKYWGAAHGLAGIMHVLMDMELKPDEVDNVKDTLHYMIKNRFLSGNYPSSEGSESDRLVHWCHGAPGVALTMVKAAEVFGSKEFMEAAEDAAKVVWDRGLLKRCGICHGISGNTYVFLSLYRLTGNGKYLYQAKAFVSFLHDKALKLISEGRMHGGDRPYSLFEGVGGMAYLFFDMVEPSTTRYPAYEL